MAVSFKLSGIVDIERQTDGRCFRGDSFVLINNLVEYFNGHVSTNRKPETVAHEAAIGTLRELVGSNHVGIGEVPFDLLRRVREAAFEYVNSFNDDGPSVT